MATDWAINTAAMVKNPYFIEKAQALLPRLYRVEEFPVSCEEKRKSKDGYGKGDVLIFDFGHNHAAYFRFFCRSVGSPMDAPAFLHIKFCETEKELWEDTANYNGWISKGWLQEEWLHIDELPRLIEMERRYAFRFVKITVLDTSPKFRVVLEQAARIKVSSVKEEDVELITSEDALLQKIDEASVRTLANCMQTVFEDGPKRDRRLWLGDLRLQALTNYETFKNQNLVKRCLYLFAGLPNQKGMIPACIFERPEPLMDDTFLLDYALFFAPVLAEYYEYTKDKETLEELAQCAFLQMDIAMEFVENGIVCEEGKNVRAGVYHCFIDWNEDLDKQCAMQAVILYALRYCRKLCRLLGIPEKEEYYKNLYEEMKQAAYEKFWDTQRQVFVSGKEEQISIASQVWMILAQAVPKEEAAALLERTKDSPVVMVTPYMHHFYVTALLESDEKAKAAAHVKAYWGGMIQAGADTFWELYNPANEKESPYGSHCVNSYCHAWSCTPAYLLRKYGLDKHL